MEVFSELSAGCCTLSFCIANLQHCDGDLSKPTTKWKLKSSWNWVFDCKQKKNYGAHTPENLALTKILQKFRRTSTSLHSYMHTIITGYNGVFPKWNRNSVNSGNLINHWSMNWAPFKDPVSHMCLTGAVVTSWSLTQEVAGWKDRALLL